MRLEPLFESVFIEDNYNCRKGKGTLYGVQRLKEKIKECSDNYTKDCWIGKFDMQRFFISIHKPTLYRILKSFIKKNYKGEDISLLLYLVKKVVMNKPQNNCIKKSPKVLWDRLDKNKSLFACGDDYGLPIGNLTSQIFANFYLNSFDIMVENKFKYYGRYVDDFFIVTRDKQEMISYIKDMRDYLWNNLQIRLHPDKVYIQHYTKGVKFIGSVVKKDRLYIANTTISNIYNCIRHLNESIDKDALYHFVSSLNSYFGFLKHHLTYAIKYRILKTIDKQWKEYMKVSLNLSKFSVNAEYDKLIIIKNKILNKEIL